MYATYIKIVLPILVVGLLFGFILPALISSTETELVIIGIFIILLTPIIGMYVYNKFYKTKRISNNEEY